VSSLDPVHYFAQTSLKRTSSLRRDESGLDVLSPVIAAFHRRWAPASTSPLAVSPPREPLPCSPMASGASLPWDYGVQRLRGAFPKGGRSHTMKQTMIMMKRPPINVSSCRGAGPHGLVRGPVKRRKSSNRSHSGNGHDLHTLCLPISCGGFGVSAAKSEGQHGRRARGPHKSGDCRGDISERGMRVSRGYYRDPPSVARIA